MTTAKTLTTKSALQLARESEGFSRAQVGRMLWPPVTARTISRWETGVTPIAAGRLRELALIYRVPQSDLTREASGPGREGSAAAGGAEDGGAA